MDDAKTCAIASLLYAKRPLLNFAHIVGELHTTLRNCPHKLIRVSWDHEDLAIFDLDGSRITLGWAEAEEGARRPFARHAIAARKP